MDSSMCSSAPDPEMWIIQGTLACREIQCRSNFLFTRGIRAVRRGPPRLLSSRESIHPLSVYGQLSLELRDRTVRAFFHALPGGLEKAAINRIFLNLPSRKEEREILFPFRLEMGADSSGQVEVAAVRSWTNAGWSGQVSDMRLSPSARSLEHSVRAKRTKREKVSIILGNLTIQVKSGLAVGFGLSRWLGRTRIGLVSSDVRTRIGRSFIPDVSGSRRYTARSSWAVWLGRRTPAELF
ncbi:hypothetical protein F2Q69_00007209 [Brassica cretica]|uniref:Uncharacterized protein ycf68 n=1 Tax=Brassica cretica TaxID=69181 RepID=A0A8S9P2M4_BRACR|nr:hypothetical protein F2Q69_00007209 [Brassica cretica]